jgi:hypothetical protein
MLHDSFGQATSLGDADALEAWERTATAFLAHGAATPDHLARTLELAPGFAQGHATKGLFLALLGRRETVAAAGEALAEARAAEGGALARERAYVDALADYLGGRPEAAADRLDAALAAAPGDALAVKLVHGIRFVLGDAAGMLLSLEAVLPAYGADHPARGYVLGCHAFALEETGAHARAEARGREGLALRADDAWGLHAVSHVHDMRGDARAGLAWLDGRDAAWAHCNNFRFHVWWHKALLHLDLGEREAALALYDAEIRAERTDDYRDIANATSLLTRLELDGTDVGDRWEELAALSMARTEDGCLIFADLHYLLALTGDRRPAAARRLVARIRRDAARAATTFDARCAAPGVAAAEGLEAFGAGRYARAFERLRAAGPTLQGAGGSHAQRDVFERLAIDAGIRAGLLDDAGGMLAARTARRGGREDGYAAARRALIGEAQPMPAE